MSPQKSAGDGGKCVGLNLKHFKTGPKLYLCFLRGLNHGGQLSKVGTKRAKSGTLWTDVDNKLTNKTAVFQAAHNKRP